VLPVGTVTLLLSDFEGSVRAWQADPDAMGAVVGELEDLVADAIGRHGGVRPVEQGEGDSFVAAFSRATEAVAAALEIQLATTQRSWPGDLAVRLRMALHTGEAQLRDQGNYMGAAINRCARLRALTHGGQVLLSGATHDLVADHHHLDGVDFADLGTHRLRDLARPEHVYQLRHPGLGDNFPPLRGLDVVPNNLPTQLTSFIGRSAEVAQVARTLQDNRLVTLTGSGGCGKTRLAVQAAAEMSATFPDGVWFADLSPVTDADGVATALVAALGAVTAPGQPPLDAAVARARSSSLLVVLDNCEHVIDACCSAVEALLRGCPDVRVLATSREVLGVGGEVSVRVPSLPLPPATDTGAIDALATSDAVRLFVDRALRARPNFTVTNETAGDVASICRRLDGIPLAIELAAARVRVLSPAQIAAGLDDRFRLLGGGARTALARQQTLAASVAWSHDLLTDDERAVFRRLSVFSGSFDLDAAEAVAAGDTVEPPHVLDLLSALVDKSLIQAEDHGSWTRYRILETLRAFATDRLADATEVEATYSSAAHHFLGLSDTRYERFAREFNNVRGVLLWALSTAPDLALRLATAIALLCIRDGDIAGARRWLETALANDSGNDAVARARALSELAYVCFPLGDYGAVEGLCQEALGAAEKIGDDRAAARAHNARGWAFATMFGVEQGAQDLDQAIELARRCGDDWCLVDALKNRGYATVVHGDPVGAREWLQEAIAAAQAAGDLVKVDESALWLGWAEYFRGRPREARAQLEGLAQSFERRRVGFFASVAHGILAGGLALQGEIEGARAEAGEALKISHQIGAPVSVEGSALIFAASVEWLAGDLEAGKSLGEQAVAVCGPASPPLMRSAALGFLARVLLERGDVEGTRAINDEALAVSRSAAMPWQIAFALLTAARIAEHDGDRGVAEDLVHEALALAHNGDNMMGVTDALESLARLAASAESYEEAARLIGAADAVRRDAGCVPGAADAARRATLQQKLADELGEDEFTRARDDGASLDVRQAVEYARRGRGERKRPSSGWDSLTPTELEVVRLATQGLTNPEIAARMFITRATVKAHLGHIFPKLGVTTRAELAALATRHGVASDTSPT